MRKILLVVAALVSAGPLAFGQNPCPSGQSLYTLLGVSCVYQDRIFSNFVVSSDPDNLVIIGDQITVIFGGNPFNPSITFVYDDGPSLQIERRNQRRNRGSSSDVDNVVDLVTLATARSYVPALSMASSSGRSSAPEAASGRSSSNAGSAGSSSSGGSTSVQGASASPGPSLNWFAPVPIQLDIPSFAPSTEGGGAGHQDLVSDSNLIGFNGDLTESPEPTTMLLIGMGLSGVALFRRRRTH